jgi:prevent-host-death family protein
MRWTLTAAQENFEELVQRATAEGPQVISSPVDGDAVMLSKADFDRLRDLGAQGARSLPE